MTADWRDSANCLALDVNDFYPEKGGSVPRTVYAVCAECDVRQVCLDWAIEHGERDGIWGGLSPTRRHKIAKARKAVA